MNPVKHNAITPNQTMVGLITLMALMWFTTEPCNFIGYLFTYVHELGHATAVWLLGGVVVSFNVYPDNSGEVFFTGAASSFPVLIVGYMSPLVFSLMLTYTSLTSNRFRAWSLLFAYWLMIPLVHVNGITVTILCASVMFFAMLSVASRRSQKIVGSIVGCLGIVDSTRSILHSLVQINHLRSDAFFITNSYGGTPEGWGKTWLVISVACVVYVGVLLYNELRRQSTDN